MGLIPDAKTNYTFRISSKQQFLPQSSIEPTGDASQNQPDPCLHAVSSISDWDLLLLQMGHAQPTIGASTNQRNSQPTFLSYRFTSTATPVPLLIFQAPSDRTSNYPSFSCLQEICSLYGQTYLALSSECHFPRPDQILNMLFSGDELGVYLADAANYSYQ